MARCRKSFSLVTCFFGLTLLAACAVDKPPLAQLSATVATLPDVARMPAENTADPSRGARPALTAAKHELRDWIEAELVRGSYRDDIDAGAFAAGINAKLKAAKIPAGLRAWSDNGVLIVVTSFDIVCGTDDSIYGWSWDGKAWRRVIEHEITDYTPEHYNPESVDGLENVHFAPAGEQRDGKSYVLVTAVNTWCTSGWQDRRFQLYAVDKRAIAAKLLVDDRAPAFTLEGNRNATLSSDRMAIEYTGGDVYERRKQPFREAVLLFSLEDGKATRIPWGAIDAEDFTEKWLAAPWAESAAVSASGDALRTWHDRLHDEFGHETKGFDWTTFAKPVRCADSDLFQFAILHGQLKPDGDLDGPLAQTICRPIAGEPRSCEVVQAPHLLDRLKGEFSQPALAYFVSRQIEAYRYQMVDVRKTPRPGCPAMGE